MLAASDVGELDAVRAETEAAIRSAVANDQRTLVETPPQALEPDLILGFLEAVDPPVTYLAPRRPFYTRASSWAEGQSGITARVIPSPYQDCPTIAGENQGETEKARRLYRRGFSAGSIHGNRSVKTPCDEPGDSGPTCDYLQRREAIHDALEDDRLDLIIGNHQHARNEAYVTDRIVLIDRFNPWPFEHVFPAKAPLSDSNGVKEMVKYFLSRLNTWASAQLSGIKEAQDLIDHRDEFEVVEDLLNWFERNEIGLDAYRVTREYNPLRARDTTTHRFAPLVTFALLTMRPVDAKFDIAPPPEDPQNRHLRTAWEESGLHPNTRCVRNRESGQVHLLRPPDLEPASQVIGLDVLPLADLWNLVFGGADGFQHRQVIPRAAYDRYLDDAVNMTIRRVGRGRYPYVGGRISELDRYRFATIRALEGKRFPLVSTSRALERYRERDWIAPVVSHAPDDAATAWDDEDYKTKSFGSARWSTDLEPEPLGVLAGIPYPGHDVLRTWAGFLGEAVEVPDRGAVPDQDGVGTALYDHYVRHRLLRTVMQFGQPDAGAEPRETMVYAISSELPSFVEPDWTLQVHRDQKATRFIEYLIEVERSDDEIAWQNAASVDDAIGLHVSYARDLFDTLDTAGLVTSSDRGKHGSTLYRWTGDEALRPVSALPNDTHALLVGDKAYLLSL